ncbi:MAG TPA: bifunctional precorrin-2 dehydrogenase/sirohydrochlorin ferrochelatase [Bryobacteraceae bacterium]|nr:bifunctional precorrin-2 dehydrogenase/sirohydrochlorin ferrochelatase [Bryobacteraceae bacterium]
MSYLVNLAINGRLAVVIGAGEVAARKIQDLLEAGASVTVVAPHACDLITALAQAGRIQAHLRPYAKADLAGAFVAVVATDDEEVNARVAADAAATNVLVNVVDRPALCTFTVPATVRRGDLTLAVATEGRCPALAGILREELEMRYGAEYAELVTLFGDLRQYMIAQAWNGQRIRETLTRMYQDGVTKLIAAGDRPVLDDFLRSRLGATVPPLLPPSPLK